MWTTGDRPRYDRSKLRYPSDLTDDEWSLTKPLIARAKSEGKQTVPCEGKLTCVARYAPG